MENASKALIIAGAILISILLISVAILVINNTSGVQDQMTAQMSATEVQTYNAQFNPYVGRDKTAAQIRTLFQTVNASNSNNSYKISMSYVEGTTTSSLVTVTGSTATVEDAASTTIAGLDTRSRYTVSITQDSQGAFSAITVTKQ